MIKRVVVLAAMVIFAGTMISGAEPARATYYHDYQDYMYVQRPSGIEQLTDTFWIDANFTDYGRHVGLSDVTIVNPNSGGKRQTGIQFTGEWEEESHHTLLSNGPSRLGYNPSSGQRIRSSK